MINTTGLHNRLAPPYRYALAIIFFTSALVSHLIIFPANSGPPFITFYPAIILGFYFCGTVPGTLVAMLSGLTGTYYFMSPILAFSADRLLSASSLFFTITASLIGFFIMRLHKHILQLDVILDNEMIGSMTLKNRRVIWCNKAMCRIVGYAPAALVGASTKMLFADEQMFEKVGREGYAELKQGKNLPRPI